MQFFFAVKVCFLLLFFPSKFKATEIAYNAIQTENETERDDVVRSAIVNSFLLVVLFSGAGYFVAKLLTAANKCALPVTITWVQIDGTGMLLWGTLFVRGFEILSLGGLTLSEKVNQWLYRALYCVGTAMLVFSLAWPVCK
jgi:hypothetical protein